MTSDGLLNDADRHTPQLSRSWLESMPVKDIFSLEADHYSHGERIMTTVYNTSGMSHGVKMSPTSLRSVNICLVPKVVKRSSGNSSLALCMVICSMYMQAITRTLASLGH